MVAVPLGMTEYRRRGARTPEVALVNMIIEKDPTNQIDGLVRFQRPGLALFATTGAHPIRGLFRKSGALSSNYLVLAGVSFYTVSPAGVPTLYGASIAGVDNAIIDCSPSRAIIVADGFAYSFDGATVTLVNMPSGERVSSVAYIAGYFILTVQDSQIFFWIAPGETDPDPLSFASAENSPDATRRVIRLHDELWFFGEQTTQVFGLSGDLDAPFQPIIGRVYDKGAANKDAIAVLDNTLFWIGNDLIAYRADTTPVRISDHSMEERLRDNGIFGLVAWAYELDGHTYFCVRVGDVGTWAYDVESQTWPRFKSFGQETWRALIGVQIAGDKVVAGDDQSGVLWMLDPSISNDNGDPLERELTGGVGIVGNAQKCASLELASATGWAAITGAATNPLVKMRYSDDGGNIWSSWIEIPMGLQGQYLTRVIWRQLGLMQAPGRIFTFRVTDDALWRVSYCRMNEAVSL